MATKSSGTIRPDSLYPLSQLREVTGLGQHVVQRIQRDGLQGYKVGNVKYVMGRDFIEYVKSKGTPNFPERDDAPVEGGAA